MPHKKKSHGHRKTPQETNKSQPSKATPKPAAQVSTVKPAQFEKASSGSAMATKAEVVTTATGGATGSGVTAGGSAAVGTAGKEAPKAKPEIAPVAQAKTTARVPSAAGTAATASTAATTAVAKAKQSPKGSAKVQVEVPATTVKSAKEAPAVDPFDALASSLPTTDPVVRPVYTGPEVKEHGITSEKGQKCGEREDTLPPDYRFKDLGPPPADVKPKDVPKPLSTDEALDSLSAGFSTPAVPTGAKKDEKKGHAGIVSASSAGTANFAPPPVKKPETPAAVSSVAVPPADKKPKMDSFSLEGALSSAPATTQKSVPLEAQKAKVEKAPPGKDNTVVKPKTNQGGSMSLDALSGLGDLLPVDAPKPKEAEVRPEDIVSEGKHKKEKGVLVGEREDTLPPEYRFNEAELKKLPAPKPEPTIGTGEALDFLSEGFNTPSAAPTQKSSAPPPDKKPKMEKAPGDFSLDGALSSTTATTQKSVPANTKPEKTAAGKDNTDGKPKANQGGSMSLDALSGLGDLLPTDAPKPKEAEVRPEDIVSEGKHKKEKGVLVGEREDTLPPEYRFNEAELKKLPAPKPEPTVGTGEALDFLSEGFNTPSAAPVVNAPVVPPTIPPCEVTIERLSSLDGSVTETVSSFTASGVHAPVPTPPKKTPEKTDVAPVKPKDTKPKADKVDSMSLDALSALGDTLAAAEPKPESPKLRPEDIVSEGKHKKEKGVLVGEREDTLPPEYRFNEEELKKLPAPKPEPTIGTGEALDFLSEGFSTPSAAPVVNAPVVPPTIPPCEVTIERLSALDGSVTETVSSSTASGVHAPVPPPPKKTPEKTDVAPVKPKDTKPKADKVDSMSLDALSALGDTLAAAEPKPESPKLRPEDIVSEDKHKKEKGVLVGEREDTLPPEYRFNKEELKKLPAPKPEPTIGTGEALDFLSEGFNTPSAAPVVKAPVVPPTIPPCEITVERLSAPDVTSSAAPVVNAPVVPPTIPPCEVTIEDMSALELPAAADNALDALSDTLKDIKPTPQPTPVLTKDVVKEKKIVEERLIKMGERDDTLPPEYRPTEEDLKKMAEEKEKAAAAPKKKSMDDKTALDLLSSDFSDTAKPAAPVASSAATTKLQPPVLDSEPLKPMAGAALDSLAGSLLPDNPEFKSKTDKPKGKSKSKSKSKKHHAEDPSAADQLSAQLSSDVVPTSTKKGGKS